MGKESNKVFLVGKHCCPAVTSSSLTSPSAAPRWRLTHWDGHLDPVRGKTQRPLSSPWSGISFQPRILEPPFPPSPMKVMIISACRRKDSTSHVVQARVYFRHSLLTLEWRKWGHPRRDLIVLSPPLLFNSQNRPVRWVLPIWQTKTRNFCKIKWQTVGLTNEQAETLHKHAMCPF